MRYSASLLILAAFAFSCAGGSEDQGGDLGQAGGPVLPPDSDQEDSDEEDWAEEDSDGFDLEDLERWRRPAPTSQDLSLIHI